MSKTKIINHETSLKAMSWCIKNGITIYPLPKGSRYELEISDNGKIIRSGKLYNSTKWADKVYELYTYYYHQYSSN